MIITRLRGSLSTHTPTKRARMGKGIRCSASRMPSSNGLACSSRTAMVGSAIWVTDEPSSLMDWPTSILVKRRFFKRRPYTRCRSCQLRCVGPGRATIREHEQQHEHDQRDAQAKSQASAVEDLGRRWLVLG